MKRFRWFLAAAFSLAVCASQASASSTYNGKIVDYLTAVGLQSGGVITYNPNGGGISTNSKNFAIHSFGNERAARPLGLQSNGELYLLDVTNSTSKTITDLGKLVGHDVVVSGAPVTKDGANVLVVSSVK